MMKRRVWVAGGVAACMLLGACGRDVANESARTPVSLPATPTRSELTPAPSPRSTKPGRSPRRAGPIIEWVAVFDTSDALDELDPNVEELMRLAGRRLIVGTTGCHEGLAEDLGLDRQTNFSGVPAPSEDQLEEVIARVGRTPLVRGEYRVICV